MNQVELTVDGSAIGNPGPGGWCLHIAVRGCGAESLQDSHADTTNNSDGTDGSNPKGLRALSKKSIVKVMTDSQYVVRRHYAMGGWLEGERLDRG